MEPVFMILGQPAATAAVIAMDQNIDVQSVPYEELQAQLIKDGRVRDASMAIRKDESAKEVELRIYDQGTDRNGTWLSGRSGRGDGIAPVTPPTPPDMPFSASGG